MAQLKNPYVGPRAFRRNETLYGRDAELEDLLGLLFTERIVLLYSSSGAGKTSLVQAGLMPRMDKEQFQVLPVMRVSEVEAGTDIADRSTRGNRYICSLLRYLEEKRDDSGNRVSLNDAIAPEFGSYLSQRECIRDDPRPKLLVFDQFEEILADESEDDIEAKRQFFKQLGRALRDRSRWALFIMREDYIAGLDPYLRWIPTRLSARYRLPLLSIEAAHEAMRKPAAAEGLDFTQKARTLLIKDLRTIKEGPDRDQALLLPYVEPLHLQVVCFQLWEEKAKKLAEIGKEFKQITTKDVKGGKKVDEALRSFYSEVVLTTSSSNIATDTNKQEADIRKWFEKLISENYLRKQVQQGADETSGLDNHLIDLLVHEYLVNRNRRGSADWLEIAHDRLVEPIIDDNKLWFEKNLELFQKRALLWNKDTANSRYLLSDRKLKSAEIWIKENNFELSVSDNNFLIACRRLRTRKRLNRTLVWITVLALGFGWIMWFMSYQLNKELTETTKNLKNEKSSHDADFAKLKANDKQLQIKALIAASVGEKTNFQNHEKAALLAIQAYRFDSNPTNEERAKNLHPINLAIHTAFSDEGFFAHVPDLPASKRDFESTTFRSDGKMFALQTGKRSIELYLLNATTPRETQDLTTTTDIVSLIFSSTGKRMAAMKQDGFEVFEQTSHGYKRTHNLQLPIQLTDQSRPDFVSNRLAALSQNGSILVWDLSIGTEPVHIHQPRSRYTALKFSRKGRQIVAGTRNGNAVLWEKDGEKWNDQGQLKKPKAWESINHPAVMGLEFNSTTHEVIAIQRNGQVTRYILESPEKSEILREANFGTSLGKDPKNFLPHVIRAEKEFLQSTAISKNGKWLAIGGQEGSVELWSLAQTKRKSETIKLTGLKGSVEVLRFIGADDEWLAAADAHGSIRIWEIHAPKEHKQQMIAEKGGGTAVKALHFDQSGHRLAASAKSFFHLWKVDDKTTLPLHRIAIKNDFQVSNPSGTAEQIRDFAFFPNGKELAMIDSAGNVKILDTKIERPRWLERDLGDLRTMAISRNGKWIAMGGNKGTEGKVLLWNVEVDDNGTSQMSQASDEPLPHPSNVRSLAIDPSGRWLAVGGRSDAIGVWDLNDLEGGKEKPEFVLNGHKDAVKTLAFSDDGRWLASGSPDASILLWDFFDEPGLSDSKHIPLRGQPSAVNSVTFGKDNLLAAGGSDGKLRLWDVNKTSTDNKKTPIVTLNGSKGQLHSVSFNQDGHIVAAGDSLGNIHFWLTDIGDMIDNACQTVWRNLSWAEWIEFTGKQDEYECTCPNLPPGPNVPTQGIKFTSCPQSPN